MSGQQMRPCGEEGSLGDAVGCRAEAWPGCGWVRRGGCVVGPPVGLQQLEEQSYLRLFWCLSAASLYSTRVWRPCSLNSVPFLGVMNTLSTKHSPLAHVLQDEASSCN